MGPHGPGSPAADAYITGDAELQAAREALPGWDIREVFGGFLAVPSGTPVVQASTLGGLTAKIRRRE